jgi:hypothetical protein
MLNERQEALLNSMLINCYGENKKMNKYDLYTISIYYPAIGFRDTFNASTATRIMTDDFKAITEFTDYVIISTKGGCYVANTYEAIDVLKRERESHIRSLQRISKKMKKLQLNGQENIKEVL